MVKCVNCGTGWTSEGLPLCPICGTKVETPGKKAEVKPPVELAAATSEAVRKNGSTVVMVPPEIRKVEPPPAAPYSFPVIKRPEPPAPEPVLETPKPPVKPPPPEERKTEIRKPDAPKPEPFIFKTLKRPEPPAPEPVFETPKPPAEPPPPEERKTEIRKPDAPKPEPFIFQTLKRPEPAAPQPQPEVIVKEKSVENEPIDASAVNLPIQALKELRVAARPLNGPLILGSLAYVGVFLLPITMAFESHRVIGILGFTLAGFFAPFAPIAWLAGLAAEKRRREQGLRPERQVTLGRLLGQWGTLLLVAQTTVGLIAIAAMRLSSKFPPTFWRELL